MRKLPPVDQCVSVPDADPIFDGVPAGSVRVVNGKVCVRETDWLKFLALLTRNTLGEDGEKEFLRKVRH